MLTDHLLSLTVAAPFVAAVVLLLAPDLKGAAAKTVALMGAGASLLGALAVWINYDLSQGGLQLAEQYPLVPAYGISLHLAVDGWGVALLLLTGVIITTGVLATWTLEHREREFLVLLLVLVAGVYGVFVSQDLFVFFLFYEIAVLPMYLLIGIWGSEGKVERGGPLGFVWDKLNIGGREYSAMKLTLMLLAGSAAILVAMFAMFHAAGGKSFDFSVLQGFDYPEHTQLWAFVLLWFGFGSLGGVFPFHTWSPDGHAAAPTAVSMLHAGVLMKLGAFGVIRIGMMMLPDGAAYWVPYVGAVAVLNVVWGALSAMAQKDLKYIIAYSSVSHMGVVMLGAATLTADGWNGAIYQMVAHGMMTGLFFGLVGLVYHRAHSRWVPGMGGFAHAMPGVAAFFILAGLSSLGLPGLAGFVAEFLVFLGAWQSAHAWWAIPGIIGAFITAVYVLRVGRDVFFGQGPPATFHELSDAKGSEWAALVALGVCLIVLGVYPNVILEFIAQATSEYLPLVVKGAASGVAVLP